MKFRGAGVAAAAIAAAALHPWPVRADALPDVERDAVQVEERLALVESRSAREDEPAASRAARLFSEGETQYLLGDWQHAATLLASAVDEPAFRASRDYPAALFELADALRRQGACGAARAPYEAYLALGTPDRRPDALTGAVECAVKSGRPEAVEPLVAEAERAFAGNAPPEVRYLAAKALYGRTDLPAAVRLERAMAAFDAVPAPYRQQAAYFQGVLQIEQHDLAAAIQRFELCVGEKAIDDRQRAVADLCMLALGRVHGELGHAAEALGWYQRVPYDSPQFTDAMYETAWAYVRAGQHDAALRVASMIADLSPESPLAPEATVLQGHLLLKLGRYAEATDAYSRVINSYAPIRDELDAILSMREDPVRYFDELIGRQGKAFDVATVLPPVAVRWASTQRQVSDALTLAGDLDASRREIDEANAVSDRIDALLAKGNGLDAFPALRETYATAQAIENAAVALQGRADDAAYAAVAASVAGDARAALDAVHADRVALGRRLSALPRSAADVRSRAERLRGALDALEGEGFRLSYQLDDAKAAITGAEAWLEQHRAEIAADAEARTEFTGELRKHRAVVEGYEAELRALRQDVALARDAAAGTDALAEEATLRSAYAALAARELELLEAHRGGADAGALAALDRAGALAERLAAVRKRAEAAAARVAADATRHAGELRDRIAKEKLAIAGHAEALAAVQGDTKDLVGKIAYQSFSRVRGQFYRLVLKADVGLVDVAWARKRVRLEKIQQLSQQKGEELKQLEDDYRDLLREVD
ncbi:tetratricopeptide repeat protein [Anaeromyxobacter oryzae]|uniref:Tetratricopeptide repeat protein n=1 Tax=Anaeromyxobacter oryzae TaxID=2918170 RepID=A0ABM7WSV4_9BACT|nr:tetratricopeptide repeat protein [Anaeromyxobacter oryzae]BDG02542.1 hypothetical protein AMOR_15380 [Anaeromyxobacter oryzae]